MQTTKTVEPKPAPPQTAAPKHEKVSVPDISETTKQIEDALQETELNLDGPHICHFGCCRLRVIKQARKLRRWPSPGELQQIHDACENSGEHGIKTPENAPYWAD